MIKKTVVGGRRISVVNVCSQCRCEAPILCAGDMFVHGQICRNWDRVALFPGQ